MIPTLRLMTRKSKLNFGKWSDCTVQRLLDLRKPLVLIKAYYNYTNVNYIDDILDELGITEEYRIKKPSKDIKMLYKLADEKNINLYKDRNREGANKLIPIDSKISKARLQAKNHGR